MGKHSSRPDILGYNHYPDLHEFRQFGDFTKRGQLPADQAAKAAAGPVKQGIRAAQAYFNLPVYLTETSAGPAAPRRSPTSKLSTIWPRSCAARKSFRWNQLVAAVRHDPVGLPRVDKPLADFIYNGGWNNGLYVTEAQPNGDLKRIRTEAADAYRSVIGGRIDLS